MYHTLEISELLEIFFTFLSRKDIYRSCTRVNSLWNVVSMRIIQKKRKIEFIKIPGIRDNILLHVYNDSRNNDKFNKYLDICKLWEYKLSYLYVKIFPF